MTDDSDALISESDATAMGDSDADATMGTGDAAMNDADAAMNDGDAAMGDTDGGMQLLDAALDGATLDAATDGSDAMLPALEDLPYARAIASFQAGASAGFGQDNYPDVVLGPPQGRGTNSGSLHVLSLGVGGQVVLDFGELDIIDGQGADFIVFENCFWPSGDQTQVFAELGEVSVSEDGETWYTFPCNPSGVGNATFPGCAGWSPTLRYDPQLVYPLDPELTGGDAFDLNELGVERARYVRIRDLGTQPGSADTGGFDLDAVGLVHYDVRTH